MLKGLVTNCVIRYNQSPSWDRSDCGGGVYMESGSLVDCHVVSNATSYRGGGIHMALAAGHCTFQAFLKMTFNGRDPACHPFTEIRPVFRSVFDRNRDLIAAGGPDACLALLLPDGRTFGTCYYDPEHTGYVFLCMEHEPCHTIRGRHYRPEADVRGGTCWRRPTQPRRTG